MRPAVTYNPRQALPSPPESTRIWASYDATPEEEFHLLDYWVIIRKHLLLILGLVFGAELATAAVLFFKTPLYTAVSTILIEPETPQVLDSQDRHDEPDDTANFYRTQYEILQSKRLAAIVIRNLNLDKNANFVGDTRGEHLNFINLIAPTQALHALKALVQPAPRTETPAPAPIMGVAPGLVDLYLSGLDIYHPSEARLMKIDYTHPDPAFAAQIANAHVQAFVQMNYELHNENNRVARTYLQGELVKLEDRLEKSEAALNKYRRERGIVTLSGDEDQTMAERMNALTKSLIEAEDTRIGLQAEVATIDGRSFDAVPEVITSTLIQNLKQEVARLEGQYANLSNQFTPDYPQVAQLKAQLDQTRGRLQIEVRRVVGSVNARYNAARTRETELRDEVQAEKSRALALKDASLQDAILAREVEANRVLYKNILERIKMLGVASEARVTNISLIDAAEVPTSPSSPKKELSLVLSGFLAFLLGLGGAFVLEGADRGLRDAADLQSYLRLPSLGAVVRFALPGEDLLLPGGLYARSNGRPLLLNGSTESGGELAPAADACVIAGEAYRTIRTGIILSSATPPRTILFTSATMEEGKSVTAVNTAAAFAGLASRVLLVDADLRRPVCHQIFEDSPSPGLTDVLCGLSSAQDAVRSTRVPGLFLLSAGTNSPNPSELLASTKMRALLQSLGTEFDHVVIDSAPVLPVSDSVILSSMVDGVVLVAARETPKIAVGDAYSRLVYAGARILGAVLNRVDLEHERYYSPYAYY